MNAHGLRRYVDALVRGQRPKQFQPDEFEAAQIRTAIDLQAARPVGDAPRPQFLFDLHRRLAAQMRGPRLDAYAGTPSTTRRQVMVAASAAAAAALAADRLLYGEGTSDGGKTAASGGEMVPGDGSWQAVAASSDVADRVMHPFEHGSLVGFVRRVDGRPQAVSGICTHQGCRLWFDQADDQLRCPCHSTSFSPTGQLLVHQLPIAPKPLPRLQVREVNGTIEVLVPAGPPQRS
jgi:Rieske Fe-S protein